MARRAYAYNDTIYVGGQELYWSDDYVSGGEGKATLTYDGDGKPVLTLNNYTYSGTGHLNAAIYYDSLSPLTIVLVGNNSVTHVADSGDTTGIFIGSDVDLTIEGTGSLTVAGGNINSGRSCGVGSRGGNITISGGKVIATSGSAQTSYAIYASEKAVTISGGEVIATGGSGQYSAGILGGGVVISNAEVDATGGTTDRSPNSSVGIVASSDRISISNSRVTATGGSAESDFGKSYGIQSTSGITISGASIVAATGGVAKETSRGIHSGVDVVVSDTSTVNATGGESKTADSSGLWAGTVAISGSSSVNATGGKAQSGSHGIYGRDSVTISDKAKVEASGSADGVDTYGISCGNGSISIDGGEVTATGSNKACGGTVKNAILGRGWTDADDKQGKAAIEVNAEGRPLTYIRVQFPASMATVTKAPEPKDLTYTGSAQDLVTAGNAEDGTMQYSLNGETWSGAIPTGTNVGEYAVWYKAVGDGEYLDSEAQKLTVAIKEKSEPVPRFAVIFDGNGGAGSMDKVEADGSSEVVLPANRFSREGHGFAGWNTAKDGSGTSYADGAAVTLNGSMTLYAQWREDEPEPTPEPGPGAIKLTGFEHVEGIGDVAGRQEGDGIVIGTTGQSKRLEQFSLALPKDVEGSIEYRGHLQSKGWVDWSKDGAPCGTTGESRRVEAVQMRLAGRLDDTHSVWYRAHVQNMGWLGWARDGQAAGTAGQSLRAEAVEVQVLPKGQVPGDYVERQASYVGAAVARVHLQDWGWTGTESALEFGTTGQSKRLEAIRLSVPNQPVSGGVAYEVHAQNRGWMPAAADGAMAGTTGESRRLETVRIRLTGDAAQEGNYSVWYRVHSQNRGWLGWAHDGEDAGTEGLSLRAEAIDVQILPQGQVPAGYDGSAACVTR